jgi:hypothetical protein
MICLGAIGRWPPERPLGRLLRTSLLSDRALLIKYDSGTSRAGQLVTMSSPPRSVVRLRAGMELMSNSHLLQSKTVSVSQTSRKGC